MEQREDGGDAAVDLGLLGQTELGEDGIEVVEVTQVLLAAACCPQMPGLTCASFTTPAWPT